MKMVMAAVKVFAAVAVFGAVHSLFASWMVKKKAEERFGLRQRNGLYRVFFLAQSVVTLGGLLAYLATLPDKVLYHARGPLAWLMRLGQLSGLVLAVATAYQVGFARITGLRSLLAWRRGDDTVPPPPEAQGPAPESLDWPDAVPLNLRVRGPFRYTRHPLNLSPLPIFWLAPKMTLKRLIFNIAGTIYLVLGSRHEEARLRVGYGIPYEAYVRSGVPFYLPVKL